MQVTELVNEGLKREYKITLTALDINDKVNKKMLQVAGQIKLPGFRKGKVPVNLVKQKHGSAVLQEVLDDFVNSSLRKFFADKNFKPVVRPNVEIKEFTEGKDLEYNVQFEVYPAIPDINIEKIKLTRAKFELGKDDINAATQKILAMHRELVPLEKKRAAKKDDVVRINFEGKINGHPFAGGKADDFDLKLGSETFVPGFEDQLIGGKIGSDILVQITFPTNYMSPDLAGKEAQFDVSIKEIFSEKLPEIDDEFAKKIGFEDIAKFEEAIKEKVKKDFGVIVETKLKKELFDELEKLADFSVPESMKSMEIRNIMTNEFGYNFVNNPNLKEEFDIKAKDFETIAIRRVKLGLLLADLGKKQDVSITEEELRDAVFGQARMRPGHEQKIIEYYRNNPSALEALKGPILEKKVVDYLLGKVKISEKLVTVKELVDFSEGLESEM